MVRALFSHPELFVSLCSIIREDESLGFMDPTPTQKIALHAFEQNRWVMVNKFRQAKITTISVLLNLLRDCMYLEGLKGLLIAERSDTAEDIFERITFSYNRLPEELQVPLATGRKAGVTQMQFEHGGSIKILTAGGRSPAIGRSIDRLVITEFGEAQWQSKAAVNIFPTLNKRPNARVVLESTPGRAGSYHERMWRMALENKGRFHALFLPWWKDETCQVDASGFSPTPEELEYLARHDAMTYGNLAFRRLALETEFGGDPRLFGSKYPSTPYDGWLGAQDPVIPQDVLRTLLETAVAPPRVGLHGCHELTGPEPTGVYLITADPAGYGSTGDNSALMVWDAVNRCDVAYWEGREEPSRFAQRILRVQQRYTTTAPCRIAVESNAAAAIALLRDMGAKNLIWTDRRHPGWYATAKRIQEAEGRLVRMLYSGELTLRLKNVLHQLMHYDGDRKKRVSTGDGGRHHFDLARTVVMAADLLSRRRFTRVALEEDPKMRTPGTLTIKDLDKAFDSTKRAVENPLAPPPRHLM